MSKRRYKINQMLFSFDLMKLALDQFLPRKVFSKSNLKVKIKAVIQLGQARLIDLRPC